MSHLERIKERQATLQAEYSPDSGLTYTEFMFSKLVDAEEKIEVIGQENELLERLKLRVAEYHALNGADERIRTQRQAVMKNEILTLALECLR